MRVAAVRDDGALLVTDGPAAAIVSAGRDWLTSTDSALARGIWTASRRPVPPELAYLSVPLATRRSQIEAHPVIGVVDRSTPKAQGT